MFRSLLPPTADAQSYVEIFTGIERQRRVRDYYVQCNKVQQVNVVQLLLFRASLEYLAAVMVCSTQLRTTCTKVSIAVL